MAKRSGKSSGQCYVKMDIYFAAAGMIDIPTEEEILAMMVEIRENPQELRFVAQRENGATPISELHRILHNLLP